LSVKLYWNFLDVWDMSLFSGMKSSRLFNWFCLPQFCSEQVEGFAVSPSILCPSHYAPFFLN
jgi:hypothetical protein